MSTEKISEIRNNLVELRNECMRDAEFDADGIVILSHAIRWLSFKEESKPYERTTD